MTGGSVRNNYKNKGGEAEERKNKHTCKKCQTHKRCTLCGKHYVYLHTCKRKRQQQQKEQSETESDNEYEYKS